MEGASEKDGTLDGTFVREGSLEREGEMDGKFVMEGTLESDGSDETDGEDDGF
jgi:hypothetical protein